ncbi:hypothetical protein KEJ45_04425 [Candidatus Bathyarchaeota archaeon]|nr:hypothetical protein [Candidatus Bathyarchaeota archaeon]
MSPLIRKVYEIKGSKIIALPKSWIEWFERENQCKIKEVAVEVGEVLTIQPILPLKAEKAVTKRSF